MAIMSEKIGYISRENGNYRKEPDRNSRIEKISEMKKIH